MFFIFLQTEYLVYNEVVETIEQGNINFTIKYRLLIRYISLILLEHLYILVEEFPADSFEPVDVDENYPHPNVSKTRDIWRWF